MDFILFILRTKVLIFKPIKKLMINHESPVFIAEMMVLTNPVPVNEVLFVEHVCFLLGGGVQILGHPNKNRSSWCLRYPLETKYESTWESFPPNWGNNSENL